MQTIKRQNVLHLVEYLYLGGIERLLEQLAGNTGDKANIYFFTYETENLRGIGKQISENGFPVFTYKKKGGRDWSLIRELIRVVRDNKIDVIHTHDFGPVEYAIFLKIRFPKIRLVHTQHTIFHFVSNRKYTLFFQFASYFYHRIIGVSHFVKEQIINHCRFMKKSVLVVIPNGVDINTFQKKDVEIDKNRLNLVSISRISSEKNLDYLLNTCRLLKEAAIPFMFHHAGTSKSPEKVAQIKAYLRENHLEENVVLHGFTTDVKGVLDLGDVFLSASITEGHPVAVLEAMASEKICFCSDISPHRELGVEFIHLFDIKDDHSLLKHLINHFHGKMLQEKKDQTKLAREKVVKCYSIDRMVDSYVGQYC